MQSRTYSLICLWFALVLGIEQAWLTYRAGTMYVPPTVLLSAMGALLGGLIGKTWIEKGGLNQ